MNKITLIINAGRSGSTFISHILNKNYSYSCYVAHEDIPVTISQPKYYNRAYDKNRLNEILKDESLMKYIEKWKRELKYRNVIETGWTAYNLCPLLYHIFGNQFRYVILHRDPVSFAFSRANQGNYHPQTFYKAHAHEVTPFDYYSIAPSKKYQWNDMNHFEKCMYWWYIVYLEAYEFKVKYPEVPCFEISSGEIFNLSKINPLLSFLQLPIYNFIDYDSPKNELAKLKETFPIEEEWKAYSKHQDIIEFANKLGYSFDLYNIEKQSKKYKLPNSIGSKIRYKINYWKIKSKITNPIKKIIKQFN
jgi:hypothetical protein